MPDQPAAMLAMDVVSSAVSFRAGSILFRPGDTCSGLLMLSAGTVRVGTTSESGRQITLYRVTPGVACVLSTQCLLDGTSFVAEAVAETDIEGRYVLAGEVDRLVRESAAFRRWLFQGYGTRLADLVLLIEDLLGPRIDRRLAVHLLDLAGANDVVRATHQGIAADIGSAREVISRHLADLARRGVVRLERGEIHLLDRQGLLALAGALRN